MSNLLDNGTVLPSGLVGIENKDTMGAWRKTYQNTSLRVGIVKASYPISDPSNINKQVPEYDVFVFEQNEDKGSTAITYRHCVAATSFGSKADFLEANLRSLTKKTTRDPVISPSGQNGAIVLLLCLNGQSDTGIIVSALAHPDRPTTLTDSGPHLEGEYNGVNIKVNKDGSTSLVFNGATDNDGNITNPSQGPTTLTIETDGSFQVGHDKITFRLDKNGDATLDTKKDTNLNVAGKINIIVKGDATVQCKELNATASGKAIIKASEINLNGASGSVLTTTTDPVIDLIFGVPTTGVPTVKSG